jgi:EDD domain protein, DegV family
MIKIVVDSTCDLPEEYISKYDIKVLPLRVSLNGTEYVDKVTIQVDEVYAAMREGIVPMTSQPSLLYTSDLFNDLCQKNCDYIYIAFSSQMSGTYQMAVSIIKELKERYPEIRMEAVDSMGGSTATGLIALQAVKLIENGYNYDMVLKQINELRDHVEHIFTITDLRWLAKGGRITKTEGIVGNILDIKPILDVRSGVMEVIKKVRGKRMALNSVADLLEERSKSFPGQVIGISHADDMSTAQELVGIIKKRLGDKVFVINKIGSVLGSHLGIGGVGVFFFNKKPDIYID